MKRLQTLIAAAALLAGSPPPALAAHAVHPTHRGANGACCGVPAGAAVEVELAKPVGTKTQRAGDTFALRLASPLIVDGKILLRAGAPGRGRVVEASGPGMGGKPAKLVLDADYIVHGGRRLPLEGLQLSGAGRSNTREASAVGLTGMLFAPLGFAALAVRGGEMEFPAGTRATAHLAGAMVLPSLGRASARAIAASNAAAAPEDQSGALIAIPPPPAGEGQVVFFRRRSLMATAQWFKVREGGREVGKLGNAAWFVRPLSPGDHTFTASLEPELKDHLTLRIAAGETYFVEGTTSRALVIGAANLSPSSRAAFEAAAAHLRAAEAVVTEKPAEVAPSVAVNPAAAPDPAATTAPAPAPDTGPTPTVGADPTMPPAPAPPYPPK